MNFLFSFVNFKLKNIFSLKIILIIISTFIIFTLTFLLYNSFLLLEDVLCLFISTSINENAFMYQGEFMHTGGHCYLNDSNSLADITNLTENNSDSIEKGNNNSLNDNKDETKGKKDYDYNDKTLADATKPNPQGWEYEKDRLEAENWVYLEGDSKKSVLIIKEFLDKNPNIDPAISEALKENMLRNSGIDCDGDIEKLVEKTAEALTSEEILDKDINEVKEKSVKKAAESTVQEEN